MAENDHSLFCKQNKAQLNKLFEKNIPCLAAWGVHEKLAVLSNVALPNITANASFVFDDRKQDAADAYFPSIKKEQQ